MLAATLLCIYATGNLGPGTRANARAGWSEYRDAQRGFSVQFPAYWRRADFPMFPPIFNPKSILAVSTFAIPRGAGKGECGIVPSQVDRGVGRLGAAVLLTESFGLPPKVLRHTSSRPRRFRLDESHLQRPSGRSDEWFFNFRDHQRLLTAAVVLGPDASEGLRHDAVAVLDSLRFDSPPADGAR
jgi:hypothetical protein